MSSRKKKRKTKAQKINWIIAVAAIVIVIAAAAGIYLWMTQPSPEASEETSAETLETVNLELEDRMEAPYEYWLSAAVLTGISIEYPSFESVSFYLSGETTLEEMSSSAGIYVTFTADGEEKCICAVPLEAERSEAGTKDIYSEVIGFATFDEVAPSEIPADYTATEIDEINELITQSTRVTVNSH